MQWRRKGVCRPGKRLRFRPQRIKSILQSGYFFQNFGHGTSVNPEVPCFSLQCHSLPSSPPISHPFFLPLEIGPLNPTIEGLESAVSFPAESGTEPQPKLNVVHFNLKSWHLVATNLKIFWESNDQISRKNFQILCWIWKRLNSAKHWIAIACSKTITGQYGSTVLQQLNDQ